MAEPVFDAMGAVMARWTMGATAASAAPMWSAELGNEAAEAELRLLALSGQFLGVAVTAEPPAGLRTLPDIPVLPLPTVPERLRPLIRRLLAAKELRSGNGLLHLIAARGWTVHPGDWMPAMSDEDAPDVYAPWRDWAEIAASADASRQQADGGLTAENWDDYWPAARKQALTELRRRDPDAARTLIEAKLAGENADVRLRLLGLLAVGLSDADASFLEGIAANDRAPKVKALATSFLGRLGRGTAAGEDAAELAGFFSVETKGLLRRSRVIEFRNTKTPAQRQRRAALFESLDISAFASALGLAPEELIGAWRWNVDQEADHALVGLVARTGADPLVALVAEALGQNDAIGFYTLATLAPRLASDGRARIAAKILGRDDGNFTVAAAIAGADARLDKPLDSTAGAALLAALKREDAKPSDQIAELYALGLIASRDGARQALERLNGAGLLQGDPRLDMLRLNAALDDNGAKQ